MKKARFALAALLALTFVALRISSAQDKPKLDSATPVTTLKVQVTFTEHEGEKKLANLPYTFFVKAGGTGRESPLTKVRVGSRVPVYAGKDGGMQYIDVGTNIDARGLAADDGRFDIVLNLERSWVEGDVLVATERSAGGAVDANSPHFKEPIIRQFKTELTLTMRDGQTVQTTQAADPLSGRVLTITVTMNVVK
ncbi:MAG: hypothetical protein WBL63_06770 [Candidatus Acidiferrum sp.]